MPGSTASCPCRPNPISSCSRPWLLALLAVALLTAGPVNSAAEPADLAGFVQRGMDLWHVPGMAVTVVDGDKVLFRQGFGMTAMQDGQPVDEHTLFAIGSTTKAMVAAGMLMLVDDGKLSLDDPVSRHLPELHFNDGVAQGQIRVRDLLTHSTGLPSTDFWSFFQDMPLDEQITRLPQVPAAASIRTRLIYQNTMFDLVGLVIQRLSGQRWDRFLAERLWQPIGMAETFGSRGQIGPGLKHVLPHVYLDERLSIPDWDLDEDNVMAAGSVWSSAHDMGLWAQFLLRGGVTAGGQRLISEAGIADMFEPHQLAARADFYPTTELTQPHWRSYGLAWFQQDFQGRKIDFHTGSLNGLIAIIGLDRAAGKAVVALGNRDHAEMRHAVLWEVMDERAGAERPDWNQDIFDLYQRRAQEREQEWQETQGKRVAGTRPSLPLDAYVGTYRSEINGDISVAREGQALLIRTAQIELGASHWHFDSFLVEYRLSELRGFVTFRIDPDGRVAKLELMGDTFTRVEPEP